MNYKNVKTNEVINEAEYMEMLECKREVTGLSIEALIELNPQFVPVYEEGFEG